LRVSSKIGRGLDSKKKGNIGDTRQRTTEEEDCQYSTLFVSSCLPIQSLHTVAMATIVNRILYVAPPGGDGCDNWRNPELTGLSPAYKELDFW